MRSLGIRVSGEEINLSIVDQTDKEIILDKIILPSILDFPRRLKYLRFNLIDILAEYDISYVSIKTIEYNSQNIDINRCCIEGVIQESLATSNILCFTIENLKGLSKKLNISTDECKKIISKQNLFVNYLTNLGFEVEKTNDKEREAALLALSTIMDK